MPAIALLTGTASRSRARRALRLRSPRETPPRSDTDVLLLRVGSEPEQRIRRTSSRPRPTRKTTYYAAYSAPARSRRSDPWPYVAPCITSPGVRANTWRADAGRMGRMRLLPFGGGRFPSERVCLPERGRCMSEDAPKLTAELVVDGVVPSQPVV